METRKEEVPGSNRRNQVNEGSASASNLYPWTWPGRQSWETNSGSGETDEEGC